MKHLVVACVGVVALLGFATSASAAAIIGTLGIAGSITYDTTNTSGGAVLDFETNVPPPVSGSGTFFNVSSITGYFAGKVTGGESGTILDLTNDPTKVGVPGPVFAPAGTALAVTGFLNSFVTTPGLEFNLTEIPLQSGTACTGSEGAGDTCVEGPFSLTQTDAGLRVNFDVFGFFVDGADSGFFDGAFSSTFTGMTFAEAFRRLDVSGQILACGVSPTNTPQTNNQQTPCSFDANFVNIPFQTVPEPVTLLTFGAGTALVGLLRKKKQRTL